MSAKGWSAGWPGLMLWFVLPVSCGQGWLCDPHCSHLIEERVCSGAGEEGAYGGIDGEGQRDWGTGG